MTTFIHLVWADSYIPCVQKVDGAIKSGDLPYYLKGDTVSETGIVRMCVATKKSGVYPFVHLERLCRVEGPGQRSLDSDRRPNRRRHLKQGQSSQSTTSRLQAPTRCPQTSSPPPHNSTTGAGAMEEGAFPLPSATGTLLYPGSLSWIPRERNAHLSTSESSLADLVDVGAKGGREELLDFGDVFFRYLRLLQSLCQSQPFQHLQTTSKLR